MRYCEYAHHVGSAIVTMEIVDCFHLHNRIQTAVKLGFIGWRHGAIMERSVDSGFCEIVRRCDC